MSVSCNYYFFECTLKDPLTARNGDVSSSKVRTGPAVIGFLAVAMTLPNIYILPVRFFFFLCFWFHNGKANNKK